MGATIEGSGVEAGTSAGDSRKIVAEAEIILTRTDTDPYSRRTCHTLDCFATADALATTLGA